MSKSVVDRDLVEAYRASVRGEPFLYPGPFARSCATTSSATGERVPDDPLTPRETKSVKLIAESRTSREIAEELVISDKTVERHRANILARLGVTDRGQLARYAIRRGLIEA